jgi:hypothetical protein
LVPAGINFLAMSAYLIGLARAYAAQPKAKATLNATMLRQEREEYERELRNNPLPNEEALQHDDGNDSLRELLARADGQHPMTAEEEQRVADYLDATSRVTPARAVGRATDRPQDQNNS